MDNRRDDGDVELLGGKLGTRNDVVEEFLSGSGFSGSFIPGAATGIGGERTTFRVLLLLLGSLRGRDKSVTSVDFKYCSKLDSMKLQI